MARVAQHLSTSISLPGGGQWVASGLGFGHARTLCDVGVALRTHVPSDDEWDVLVDFKAQHEAKPVRGVIADVSKELGQPATTVLVMQEAGGAWGARILPFEDSKLWVVSADTLGDPAVLDHRTPLAVLAAARITSLTCEIRQDRTAYERALKYAALSEEGFQLSVRTLIGKSIALTVLAGSTIDELKGMIQDKEGIPQDQQRFVYEGQQLEDGRTVADYGLQAGGTIYLVLRLRGGMFHNTSGRDDFTVLQDWNASDPLMGRPFYACIMRTAARSGGGVLHVPVPSYWSKAEQDERVARALGEEGMRTLEMQLVPAHPRVGKVLRLSVPACEYMSDELERLVALALG